MNSTSPTSGLFVAIAKRVSKWTGSAWAFGIAFGIIVTWGITGPIFNYSDTWQLVINTGTTIVTFLMVFLIQNTQNRDSHAMQLKLDELIRATEGAHLSLLDLEELEDIELENIRKIYERLAEQARDLLDQGKSDANTADINTDDFLHNMNSHKNTSGKVKPH